MPGTLAQWYQEAGGEAVLMGKPSPLIYAAAAALAPAVPRGRWLAVGDSLAHDVAGCAAAAMGRSLLVVGGIHAGDAALRCGGGSGGSGRAGGGGGGGGSVSGGNAASEWNDAALAALCREHGAAPTYACAWLEW